ncbi:MAG: TonB-dependent receptor [Burkholderiaceae bacterium]
MSHQPQHARQPVGAAACTQHLLDFAPACRATGSPGRRTLALAVTCVFAGLAAGGLLASRAALAAEAEAAADPRDYAISAGKLSDALAEFAAVSGVQLVFDPQALASLRSSGLQGRHSVVSGFAQLLAGSGYEAVSTGNGHYVLRQVTPRQESATDAGEAVASLATVMVTARPERADGLPEAYAGGQVARGGRVGMLGDKDVMDTPFSTIAYTEKFIEDRQARNVVELISATDPAVFNAGTKGGWSDRHYIRGFGVGTADTAINGLYGVTPYARASPEMFERVEVLKGPSALLNGMPPGGSVGGSVNLVPKRAPEDPLNRATLTYMSKAQFGTHVDLARRFGEQKQFGARFNGVYRDGEVSVTDRELGTRLFALGLDWRGERARLSLDLYSNRDRVDGFNTGLSLAPGLGVPKAPSPDTRLSPPWTFAMTQDKAAIFRGEVDVTEDVIAYAAYGVSKTNFELRSGTNTLFDAAGDIRSNVNHSRSIYNKRSADVGARGKFRTGGIGHELTVNATRFEQDTRSGSARNLLAENWVTNIYDPVWGPLADRDFSVGKTAASTMTSIGIADTLSFFQDQVQLTLGVRRQSVVSDTIDPTTGARTDRYDASATSPAIALNYRLTGHVSIYGNYIEGLSEGMTAPMTSQNAGQLFPPYKAKQKEVGLKWDLGRFTQTFSVYEIKQPSSYTDPVTNVFSFGGEQRNRGVEWNFFGEAARGVRLIGGLGYLEPKLTKTAGGVNQGKLATGLPKLQAKLGTEWDIPAVDGLTLLANATYVSKRYINADNSQWVGGRAIYDLGIGYAVKLGSRPLTLRAIVTNVANKAYWGTFLADGLGEPRTFRLAASMGF